MAQSPANSVSQTSASNTRANHGRELGKDEQNRLIGAIESAMEVTRKEQFDEWLRGPFRDLLPHELLVSVELRQGKMVRSISCLHHGLLDTRAVDALCDPKQGVIARLVNVPVVARCESCVVDARLLVDILGSGGDGGTRDLLNNALVERVTLLSGDSYGFVLGNIPTDELARCRILFRLVAAHLKMALARTLAKREGGGNAALTSRELEVLRWISKGKSNREISDLLGISAITLKSHISKLYRKLNVQSRSEAVAHGLGQISGQTDTQGTKD